MRNDGKTTLLVACFSFVHEHARMRVCGASVCVLGMFSFTWGDVILNLAKSYSPVGSPPYSIQSHSRLNWTTVPDAQRETETEKDRTKEAIKEIETFAVLFFFVVETAMMGKTGKPKQKQSNRMNIESIVRTKNCIHFIKLSLGPCRRIRSIWTMSRCWPYIWRRTMWFLHVGLVQMVAIWVDRRQCEDCSITIWTLKLQNPHKICAPSTESHSREWAKQWIWTLRFNPIWCAKQYNE